jgi:hypothetical protein
MPSGEATLEEPFEELAARLAGMERLVKLKIAVNSDQEDPLTLDPTGWTTGWASATTLREVAFASLELSVAQLSFLEMLAPSLQSLELAFDYFEEDVWEYLPSVIAFSRLTSLALDCGIPHAHALLSAFSRSPLQHLSIGLSSSLPLHASSSFSPEPTVYALALPHVLPGGDLYSLIHSRLHPLRTLHTIKLGDNYVCDDRLPPFLSLAVARMAADFGVVRTARSATGPGRRDAFFDPVEESWSQEEKKAELEMALGEVKEVIKFGDELRQRCEREQDRAGLASLIEALGPLKARFELELD